MVEAGETGGQLAKSLQMSAVYLEKKNVFDLGDQVIRTFGEIDGKIFKSGVRKGDVLKPNVPEDYVHRIGRTARLGARGEAISFACENYAFHLPEIEEYIGYPIQMEQAESELMPEIKRAAPKPRKPRHSPGGDNRKRRPRHRRPRQGSHNKG